MRTVHLALLIALLAVFAPWATVADATPTAPRLITPTSGANVPIATPVVRWIGDAHDRYEVHINTVNSPEGASAWDSGQVVSSTDVCDVPALANGSYYAFVRLRDGQWGPWSPGVPFTINVVAPAFKKGWVLIRDDVPYHLDLLTHAREYHVNHVQLSHSIMMYAWEPINNSAIRNKVNQLINAAHANGVNEVVLWVHDIQNVNLPPQYVIGGKVNLDDPGFWAWLDSQYEQLFSVCPNADGLVLTFSENFSLGSDFNDRMETIHTGKTPEDSLAQAIETVWNVCSRHNKSLYVRTWMDAGPDRWVRNAVLRNNTNIWMMSKATGAGDWDVIKEDYDIIGTATGHPELVEFDFVGEYWGYTHTPWAGIDYIKHLWTEFSVPKGADGICARIDRENQAEAPGINPRTIECPNRINMFALDALAEYPNTSVDDIYEYWSKHWFGQAGEKVASAMKRTFDITNACYGRPNIYPFSSYVAKDDCLQSIFDIDCVKPILQSTSLLRPGYNDYNTFRARLTNAAAKLSLSVPSILWGDFSPAYSNQTSPTCSATVVDVTNGINPALFTVEYSTNGGSTWTSFPGFTYSAAGGATEPYTITAASVPFGQLRAGRNKIRFGATNLLGTTTTKTYTVRGLDVGSVTLAATITADGISHPQGGDGDTTATTQSGRECRTPTTSSDVNFYFQFEDGFAYDGSPSAAYLQVDYYGSSGSITPYYDSDDSNEAPLRPVYLSGGTGWRTATWKIENTGWGHRIGSQLADIRLYVGAANNIVFISGIRLHYDPPTGMLTPPENERYYVMSQSQVSLAWNPAPGATKYQICRNGVAVGWPTGTMFTETGLTPNTEYTYCVTAYDNSGNTSCSTANLYATTLSAPVTTSAVTSVPQPATWQTSSYFRFTATGGFGPGKVAYYQTYFDESPTHVWTGDEPFWPGIGPPSGAGWTVWRPEYSPTDPASGWLLYQGSTTQRCMSELLLEEFGYPTWMMMDQGRVVNTKVKNTLWPNLTISRDTGFTVTARMRCVDTPAGFYNPGASFGVSLPDCPEAGVIVKPDSLQIVGPSSSGAVQSVANGYTYHTYTLTLKNATPGNNYTAAYKLYRDGTQLTGATITQGPNGSGPWTGPWFGQTNSPAMGAWAWQWIAWNATGAIPQAPGPATLSFTAPHRGTGYYIHMRGFNANGVPNGTADFGPFYTWNGSTPVNPTVVDDGTYTTSDAIHVRWSPVAPTASLYEYAIGTAPGLSDIVAFTGVGLSTEATANGLTLAEGSTYYVTVRGTVGSNTYSGSSDGITVAPRRDRIGQAKALVNNAPVALYGKTVTAVLPDCAYIKDGGSGISVTSFRPMAVGDVVDLAGKMTGSADEKQLQADTVIVRNTTTVESIVTATSKVGGAAFLYNPNTGAGQKAARARRTLGDPPAPALVDVTGLNNVGSLVTVCGTVLAVQPDCFYIDDGVGHEVYSGSGSQEPPGLKVTIPFGVNLPPTGSYVAVTGVSSLYYSDIGLCRQLLVRRQSDIQEL